jgi:ABC-type multidrug transport system permease subunit
MITLKSELVENQYIEDFDRDNIHDSNEDVYKEKYEELIYQIKCRITLFYVISFLFTLFFSIYLVSFFAFYTGTKRRVLTTYYVGIIEILLIKIIYGILLATLRYASIKKGYKSLYNFVFILDKYLS